MAKTETFTREHVGTLVVYHCTNAEAAKSIYAQGEFKPGSHGMFGPAIYFAETEAAARYKASHDGAGDAVIVTAKVNFGEALVFDSARPAMSVESLKGFGANSVKGRSSPEAAWEYVVFDPLQIELISITGEIRCHSPEKPLVVSPVKETWISDITAVVEKTRKDVFLHIAPGFQLLDQNLSEGTKATDKAYIAYRLTKDPAAAIRDVALEHFHTSQAGKCPAFLDREGHCYKRVVVDLNSTAGGQYVYLSYTKDETVGKEPISDIRVHIVEGFRDPFPPLPKGWSYVCWAGTSKPADVNKGANGPYIYLAILRKGVQEGEAGPHEGA
jgi:hypothetical protein